MHSIASAAVPAYKRNKEIKNVCDKVNVSPMKNLQNHICIFRDNKTTMIRLHFIKCENIIVDYYLQMPHFICVGRLSINDHITRFTYNY